MKLALKIISGPELGREIMIEACPFVIGRSKEATAVINDPSISRMHAEITFKEGQFFITDLKSNNGILLGGRQVQESPLGHDNVFILGGSTFRVIDPEIKVQASSKVVLSSEEDIDHLEKSIFMDVSNLAEEKFDMSSSSGTNQDDRQYKKLQAMLRISNAVASKFNLDDLIAELLEVIMQETNASRGFILMYDDAGNLMPKAAKSRKGGDTDQITASQTLIQAVIKEKKALLSSDVLNDNRFDAGLSIVANQIRACIIGPMLYRDELLGVIHIDSDLSTNLFTEEDLELLVGIANQAAVCIKNAKLLNKVREEENQRLKLSQYFPPAQVEMLMKGALDLALGGKTEQVSILFCDIRKFTSISETLNATEVMQFLNDFFTVMTEIIFNFNGMVDNFMGDCIMAVFGGPFHNVAHQDASVRAAIEMQKSHKILNDKFKHEKRPTFEIGIGIHAGDVSRGNIGSPQLKKYTVIGSNVNIASRLCSVAGGGEILISESLKTGLCEAFAMEKQPSVSVKNVSEPLTPYKIMI